MLVFVSTESAIAAAAIATFVPETDSTLCLGSYLLIRGAHGGLSDSTLDFLSESGYQITSKFGPFGSNDLTGYNVAIITLHDGEPVVTVEGVGDRETGR